MTVKQKLGKLVNRISPVSPEIVGALRWEFRAWRSRVNYKINPLKKMEVKKFSSMDDISLNLGCGPFGFEGWVNVDLMNLKNVSFTYDSRRHLPFRTESVARIRVEHFFEHLDKTYEAPFFLDQCRRVMKQGAVLRIAVPDTKRFIEAYYTNDPALWKNLGYDINKLPERFDTKIGVLNHIFRQDGEHKYAYDFEGLSYLLKKHGFNNICQQQYRESLDEQLRDDQANHSNHSLYVECTR